MDGWHELTRDGVRLAWRDFGGAGPPVLLLHGLAGHAEEWAQTASWLTGRARVIAPDARGHGRSEPLPGEVGRDALVADAASVIQCLAVGPVVVVGQSLGGLVALCLAASRPDLVRGLVVTDASPDGGPEEAAAGASEIAVALREWPVPFASVDAAQRFFGERFGDGLPAQAWVSGLEQRADGWWPRFDIDVMARMLGETTREPVWEGWERIRCPVLVVRAGDGLVDPETAREMIRRLPGARLVELDGAAHDLHLDRPDEWREALTEFLDSLAR